MNQLLPRLVATDGLILLECLNEMVERFDGQLMTLDDRLQCDEHGMPGLASETPLEFLTPPRQQFQRSLGIADLVPEIIRPSTECVECGEIIPELGGHHHR